MFHYFQRFARLETGVGIGKPLQVLISLDVTFMLLNMTRIN